MVFRTSLLGCAPASAPVQVLRVQLLQLRVRQFIETARLTFVAPGETDEHEDDKWQVDDFADEPQDIPRQLLVAHDASAGDSPRSGDH